MPIENGPLKYGRPPLTKGRVRGWKVGRDGTAIGDPNVTSVGHLAALRPRRSPSRPSLAQRLQDVVGQGRDRALAVDLVPRPPRPIPGRAIDAGDDPFDDRLAAADLPLAADGG